MGRRRGCPALELLALELKESWRFPIAELLAVLYVLLPLSFSHLIRALVLSPEVRVISAISMVYGPTELITLFLVLKGISWGLAREVRKGLVQTYLTYPIGRGRFLTIKIFSAVGVPVLYVVASAVMFAVVNLPGEVIKFPGVFATALLAAIGKIVFLSSFLLLTTVLVKRGGLSVGLGIAIWFGLSLLETFLKIAGDVSGQEAYWHAFYLLSPIAALEDHYRSLHFIHVGPTCPFRPELWQCYAYLAGHYAVATAVFTIAFIYFARRFEPV